MRKCISDAPLTDVKTAQDGETGCGCWELKYVSWRCVRGSCERSRLGRGGADAWEITAPRLHVILSGRKQRLE